jgi:predicted RNA-binding protein YlqC (UPF0109 family)
VSAFDDEFGLFNDEVDEEERRPALGARQIGSGETIIDDIEPEDGGSPRQRRSSGGGGEPRGRSGAGGGGWVRREQRGESHVAQGPSLDRARGLLEFLAKRLVAKPDAVVVALDNEDPRGPVLELEVDHADLGKVIGRGGRVAQALRTLVRASAEGRVTIDILDSEDIEGSADTGEDEEFESGSGHGAENAEAG